MMTNLAPASTADTALGSSSSRGSADANLVALAKNGDRAAEEALYRRHVGSIASLVSRLLRDRSDVEDCVQETFAIALSRLAELREGDAVRAWLSQIAVNLVRSRYRKRRFLSFFGLVPDKEPPWTGASPEVGAEIARMWSIVDRLPTEERIAWSLRHLESASLDEVAVACSVSLATAKRRIAAAEAKIREGAP